MPPPMNGAMRVGVCSGGTWRCQNASAQTNKRCEKATLNRASLGMGPLNKSMKVKELPQSDGHRRRWHDSCCIKKAYNGWNERERTP